MTTRRDPDMVVAAWLDDGPRRLPAQTRSAIANAIPLIPQRRRGLGPPWRVPSVNGHLRLTLAAAAVIVAAAGGIYLLSPGGPSTSVGGPGPTASPSPTASPRATSAFVSAGTITLTDKGCNWDGKPTVVGDGARIRIETRNETNTFGNFGFYKLDPDRTWTEAAAWVVAEDEALQTGIEQDTPADFAVELQSVDAEAFEQSVLMTTTRPGTYGVVCSANEPPPGAVFHVYLVGPLEVE